MKCRKIAQCYDKADMTNCTALMQHTMRQHTIAASQLWLLHIYTYRHA